MSDVCLRNSANVAPGSLCEVEQSAGRLRQIRYGRLGPAQPHIGAADGRSGERRSVAGHTPSECYYERRWTSVYRRSQVWGDERRTTNAERAIGWPFVVRRWSLVARCDIFHTLPMPEL